jgi:hypothetical protein
MSAAIETARAVVGVMARRPGSAVVKTRLAARLDEAQRAELYEAFLRDKLAQVDALSGVAVVVAVAPPDTELDMAPWLPPGATAVRQRGADLGERLKALAADLFARHARAVILVDSDTPTLPTSHLEEAVRTLGAREADLVLGPAHDGGYYLVGMSAPQPALFRGIAWSTAAVLEQTLAIARAAALRVRLLESWYDVDTPDDLDRLVEELRNLESSTPGYPVETARRLRELHLVGG